MTPRQAEIVAAIAKHGTQEAAAKALGIHVRNVYYALARIKRAGNAVVPETSSHPAPAQIHDAAFWRRRAQEAERQASELRHLVRKLNGVADVVIPPPSWLRAESSQGKRRRSVVMPQTTDVHHGEKISASEIGGVNAFDAAICETRLRRYFHAACEIGTRWASDTDCQGALWGILGDLISGNIHDELMVTNDLTSHESVVALVGILRDGALMFAEAFGRVHITGTPGNHGRDSRKPWAKLAGAASYDTMIVALVARELRDDPRITFEIARGADVITPIFGREILDTHGDRIGTKGGKGRIGAVLPIARGAQLIKEQQNSFGRPIAMIRGGHYHYACEPEPGVLFGGSVSGYNEFAGAELRAKLQPPSQKLALVTDKWGLRERCDVQLEEPSTPARPRVRVPVGMVR